MPRIAILVPFVSFSAGWLGDVLSLIAARLRHHYRFASIPPGRAYAVAARRLRHPGAVRYGKSPGR
ncbi:hypothetical protein GCM10018987_09750 [Streptomyces cremeus]